MPELTVQTNEPAGTLLRLLTFDAPPDGYTRPGQYVVVSIPGKKPGFFAVASSPGQPLQLLVKTIGECAEELGAAPTGRAIEMSEAKGGGFALEQSAGRTLVALAGGSGISAIRPVIEAEVAAGLTRPVHLLYGVLTPDHLSFGADLDRWSAAGVDVTIVVGDPDNAVGWGGDVGFVQDVAQQRGLVRGDVSVVIAGLPVMVEQAKALFAEAGLPEDQFLGNF